MAEIRLLIPDELVHDLQSKIGIPLKATDIAKEAITIFTWAVNERAKGRVILSSDEEGLKLVRLAMPSLETVRKNNQI